VSRKIDRRQALGAFGTISLGGLLAACGGDSGSGSTSVATTSGDTATVAPKSSTSDATTALFEDGGSCTLTVEQTEGPYYFDADKVRSDIREDRDGTRLRLALRVQDADCNPVPNAVVDIWHADAGGAYSGFDGSDSGGGPPGGGPGGGGGSAQTSTRYLRGAQVTNKDGIVEFVTIYPGWYQGRTVHIHAMVHIDNASVLTTQLYFDDELSDKVYASAKAYSTRGERAQLNDSDGIYDASLVVPAKAEDGGYVGAMTFNVRSA
jgi:protocatechuate 3,4-dioxygenase beta subunit